VLCPTTSGTGSEVSGASVLTDPSEDRKIGFGYPNMRAQHALVDPVLTHGLPPGPTAHAGVDAMAQAIAACTVSDSSPLSVAFGLEACHHINHSLREAVRDGSNAEARRRLACGSLTAGLAMNLSDCAADHALAQALGSVKHLPHGLTVGLVVAETLEISRPDCADRLERVADALGEPADGTSDGSRAVRAVGRVLHDVGFPTMGDVGVTEGDIESLLEAATEEQRFFLEIDCHDWTRGEVESALRSALALSGR
jgi:alcohol dehydrogenase